VSVEWSGRAKLKLARIRNNTGQLRKNFLLSMPKTMKQSCEKRSMNFKLRVRGWLFLYTDGQ